MTPMTPGQWKVNKALCDSLVESFLKYADIYPLPLSSSLLPGK